MKRIYLSIITILSCIYLPAQVDLVHLEWGNSMEGTSPASNTGNDMEVDALGNVYIIGEYHNTADFDPGPGQHLLTSAGYTDTYIQKLDKDGNFLWAKSLGGPNDVEGLSIELDAAGNVYGAGLFRGAIDFDPGSGAYTLISGGSADAFVVKLDNGGNFVWASASRGLSSGSTRSTVANSIATDAYGNSYLCGLFKGQVDFDPGPASFLLTSTTTTSPDAFIQKLDANGNLVWVKSITGSQDVNAISIDLNAGSLVICGSYMGVVDFDPGSGTFNMTSADWIDAFVEKLDTNGNMMWAKSIGGVATYGDIAHGVKTDVAGNVYTVGRFASTVDFDPGAGVVNLTSNGISDIFIQKLDAAGNLDWAKSMGGTGFELGRSISVDDHGFVYTTGYYESNMMDIDPGPATTNVISNSPGTEEIFVQKLDPNGNFVWGESIGNTGVDISMSVVTDDSENVYLTGRYWGTVDFDPSSTVYDLSMQFGPETFVVKFYQDSCANLAFSFDSISNISCNDSGFAMVRAVNGAAPYTYSWNTTPAVADSAAYFKTPGVYTVTANDNFNCAISASVHVSAPSYYGAFDLNANLVSGNFRTGYPSQISLDAFNEGCTPVSGSLSLVLDALTSFDSSSVTPDHVNGDTLVWNFSNMTYDSAHVLPKVYVTTSTSSMMGDTVCFELIIAPSTGDVDTNNNKKHYCFEVKNSFDPNDIRVYPPGICDENYVLKDEVLTYTIRFQNIGNAEAINVNIVDSITPDLDINTLNVVGSSHDMFAEMLDENVINFRFDNIQLPDSTANEVASHGYVIFEITPKTGLPDGTEIENSSEIYFDFNEPVATNTVVNTLVSVLPSCVATTDINEYNNGGRVTIYPNPTSGLLHIQSSDQLSSIKVMDITGASIRLNTINTNTIDVSELPTGIYFIEVSTSGETITRKFIRN